MKSAALRFERPKELEADAPPELRGSTRDGVRLLVSTPAGHEHHAFRDLPALLTPGDLVVVNESATLPAGLPARGAVGDFTLCLSTNYGRGLWLTEPRWGPARPGPLPLRPGDRFEAAGLRATVVAEYPGLPRLLFVHLNGDVLSAAARRGAPIRYAYLREPLGLEFYQTVFSRVPGSAEMPSAARPFTLAAVRALAARGVRFATVVLHAGVSSLEVEAPLVEAQPLYPEPFEVPAATVAAVSAARAAGRRVVAVGTTVVRALESAHDGKRLRPARGFTRLYVNPYRPARVVDGLLTGFHDPMTSHLAMLYALAGEDLVRSAYAEAVAGRYLWHEFGDSHLVLPGAAGA
ncbi:MAG TPA: S-adenosylmethionine:tRNA ribosyltransferase-isomerase [Candidatus Thermoplasmatota archaeon]